MSTLSLQALKHGVLRPMTASFAAGCHTLLGTEADGTSTVVALVAGSVRPLLGHVLLDGEAPWSSAQTRRQIAALYADEVLLPGRDVTGAVQLALQARADTQSASRVLDAAGLSSLAKCRPSALSAREARATALAVALSHPAPRLVALHEPLGLIGLVSQQFILRSLRTFADAGAVVLCSASRLEDAAHLGGSSSTLDCGFWLDTGEVSPALAQVTLRVQTPEPHRLAARLAAAPDIAAVAWNGGQELLVRGALLERVAHSIVANARAEAIRLDAMKQDLPALELLAATRAGPAQAYPEQAHSSVESGQA